MLFKVFSFFTYIIFDNHEIIFKNGETLEKTFNLINFRRQYRKKIQDILKQKDMNNYMKMEYLKINQ